MLYVYCISKSFFDNSEFMVFSCKLKSVLFLPDMVEILFNKITIIIKINMELRIFFIIKFLKQILLIVFIFYQELI